MLIIAKWYSCHCGIFNSFPLLFARRVNVEKWWKVRRAGTKGFGHYQLAVQMSPNGGLRAQCGDELLNKAQWEGLQRTGTLVLILLPFLAVCLKPGLFPLLNAHQTCGDLVTVRVGSSRSGVRPETLIPNKAQAVPTLQCPKSTLWRCKASHNYLDSCQWVCEKVSLGRPYTL